MVESLSGQFLGVTRALTGVLLNFDVEGVENIFIPARVGERVSISSGQIYYYNGVPYIAESWSERDSSQPVSSVVVSGVTTLYANANIAHSVTFTDGSKTTIKIYSAGQTITQDYINSEFPLPEGMFVYGYSVNGEPIGLPYPVTSSITVNITYKATMSVRLLLGVKQPADGREATVYPAVSYIKTLTTEIPPGSTQATFTGVKLANHNDHPAIQTMPIYGIATVQPGKSTRVCLGIEVDGVRRSITSVSGTASEVQSGMSDSLTSTSYTGSGWLQNGNFFDGWGTLGWALKPPDDGVTHQYYLGVHFTNTGTLVLSFE